MRSCGGQSSVSKRQRNISIDYSFWMFLIAKVAVQQAIRLISVCVCLSVPLLKFLFKRFTSQSDYFIQACTLIAIFAIKILTRTFFVSKDRECQPFARIKSTESSWSHPESFWGERKEDFTFSDVFCQAPSLNDHSLAPIG